MIRDLIRTADIPFKRSNILGCPVDQMTLLDCLNFFENIIERKQKCHLVVVNAAKLVKAQRDNILCSILHSADLIGADGVPVVWASKILGQPLPGRVNGTDLMDSLFDLSARKGYRIYMLGAREKVVAQAVENVRSLYPSINIVGYRHGYFDDEIEEEKAVKQINEKKPDILFVGMGTPLKELWVRKHKENLDVYVIHGVGGSFDILGGYTKRAPKWMQKSGLEWFYRFLQEPQRMWKRYLITNSLFVWYIFVSWIKTISKRNVILE